MRKGYVLGGILFVTFGIIALFLSVAQVPYTSTTLIEVPKSQVSLSESFVIQAGYYDAHSTTFYTDRTLHITFTVSGGSNDIDFWVMDAGEYSHFSAGEGFNYYSYVSRQGVSSLDLDWHPPLNQEIYFVWDNSLRVDGSRRVSAYFYHTWTETENQTSTENRTLLSREESILLFLCLFIGGVVSAGYGFASKPTLERQVPIPPKELIRIIGRAE